MRVHVGTPNQNLLGVSQLGGTSKATGVGVARPAFKSVKQTPMLCHSECADVGLAYRRFGGQKGLPTATVHLPYVLTSVVRVAIF